MKFDICLMNPPYATTGGGTIHLQFVQKMLQCSKEQVVIMPFRFVTNIDNKQNNKFKPEFDKYLVSVKQQKSKEAFPGIKFPKENDIAIYHFSENKTGNIKINYLDGKKEELDSLLKVTSYTSYEKEIVEYLSKNDKQKIISDVGFYGHTSTKNMTEEDKNNRIIKSSNKLKNFLNENPGCYGIIVARFNNLDAKCFTSKNGQILNKYEDFLNIFLNNKSNIGYNVLMFRTKKAAENAKIALQNPVLRFTFLREQKDKFMIDKVYKYVPHIDWEDERCRTDVGLLELCGCPKDKAEEYAMYCKEIIDKVDKK